MKYLARQQRGAGLLGWMFIIAVALFFALLGVKMVPAYINYFDIVKVMESMARDPSLKEASAMELKKTFMRRIDINSIYDFPKNGFKVDRSRGEGTILRIDYEKREPMVGNVDVVMHFKKEVRMQR